MIAVNQDGATQARVRDPRLDFFRGLGLFIILFSHIPKNGWAAWIPARFGFSDSTEIFVYCSGVASALAFGRLFVRAGWLLASARIALRIWQLYWGHVLVFVVTVAMLAAADHWLPGARFVRFGLNLGHFVDDPAWMLAHFLTLTYVPNYFDILPMYFVILGMIPFVWAIGSRSRGLAVVLCVGLWTLASFRLLELPAEPWSNRPWFFNPFSWQLVFFTGFAIGMGWLPKPPRRTLLIVLAGAAILIAAPLSGKAPWLDDITHALRGLTDKTHLGLFRYLHFLALAYLAYLLAGENGRVLKGRFANMVQQVGRQALPVFLTGMVLAQALGVLLSVVGHSYLAEACVNLGGCAILTLVAYVVAWFKSAPWSKTPRNPPTPGPLTGGEPLKPGSEVGDGMAAAV
ncbi:MAG TPA: OpgC domain-containing protein [Beijerinckiaceae bacterium]|nr:OpgC domain-containing protein [Beijerinckiaceae bacterium]